jgi:hypothetical protein
MVFWCVRKSGGEPPQSKRFATVMVVKPRGSVWTARASAPLCIPQPHSIAIIQ